MEPSEKKWIFRKWIKAAGVRAMKTVAQTAIATIGVSAIMSDVNCDVESDYAAEKGIPILPQYYHFITKLV